MEANRSWHDPVVEIYGNLITPGVRVSADGYDLANRRWYRLNVEAEMEDDDWLSATITKQLRSYYDETGQEPPWNAIWIDSQFNDITYDTIPTNLVDRPIRRWIAQDFSDKLPTTSIESLRNLRYISRAADSCTWNGRECVFKRIEFDVDIEGIQAEITTREKLIQAMTDVSPEEYDDEMVRRFCLVPILAVVIANRHPWVRNTVAGILTPYAGTDLEIVIRNRMDLNISIAQLRRFVAGVHNLSKAGVEHGDIKYWNTVLSLQGDLMLIDAGTVAPDYDGDAPALGRVLLWCVENASSLGGAQGLRAVIMAAASALMQGSFDDALKCLS